MQTDIQMFYELSPFRPEWLAYVPKMVWALMQIASAASGIIILLKHKEFEHVSLPLGPFAIMVWIRRGNRLVGPITAYNIVTWWVYTFSGMILSAVLLDGLSVAAHQDIEPRPIATLVTCVVAALLWKNLILKAHIHREARQTVDEIPVAEIPVDDVVAVFARLAKSSGKTGRD